MSNALAKKAVEETNFRDRLGGALRVAGAYISPCPSHEGVNRMKPGHG